jgi:acyl-CoA synthetase (NDP forming)
MHPKEPEIHGFKAYKSLSEVPGKVDLAVLVLPTKIAADVLEECGKHGVKNAMVVSAGFAEMGEKGKKLQQRIIDVCQEYNIKMVGPNCIGIVNTRIDLNTTFFPNDAGPGFIGMASQSGSFVTQMFAYLKKFGAGFSQAISVGNEAMTDLTECVEYLGECPRTKVIAMYVETLRGGGRFIEVAREVSKKKPIVAYYVGGSEAGRKAALSHTAALSGSDALYNGVFNQCGVIRASSMAELFDICYVMGAQPLPRGNRVALLSHSGGPAACAADTAERYGMELARFSERTTEELLKVVPHTASVGNPVDITFNKDPNDYSRTLPSILMGDESVDSLFMYVLMPSHRVYQTFKTMMTDPDQARKAAEDFILNQCRDMAQLAPKYGKPFVGGSFYTRSEPFTKMLQDNGVSVLPSPERAIIALSALTRYAEKRRKLMAAP